jgi:hypothetical protein
MDVLISRRTKSPLNQLRHRQARYSVLSDRAFAELREHADHASSRLVSSRTCVESSPGPREPTPLGVGGGRARRALRACDGASERADEGMYKVARGSKRCELVGFRWMSED